MADSGSPYEFDNTLTSRIGTPLAQRLSRARVSLVPFIVWLGAASLAVSMLWERPTAPTFDGLAQTDEVRVSSPRNGPLDRLHVRIYQTVRAGDPLATIDAAGLQGSIKSSAAELEQLAAELERSTGAQGGPRTGARAPRAHEARLELNILENQLAIIATNLEADRIEVRLRLAERTVEIGEGSGDRARLLKQRLERARVRGETMQQVALDLEADLVSARDKRGTHATNEATSPQQQTDLPIEWRAAIVALRGQLDGLAIRREHFVLRAPSAGRIAALAASEGQFLSTGDTVLTLVDPRPHAVAMWVPESTSATPNVGDRFIVRSAYNRHSSGTPCEAYSMSPRVEMVPKRLWRDPRVAEYGQVCLIGPVASLGLAPGERVAIDRVERGPPE